MDTEDLPGYELLDEEALNKLNKSDLVKYAAKVSNLTRLIVSLSAKIDTLTDRIAKTESELSIAKNSNALLKNHVDLLESKVDRLERFQTQDSQYLRNKQIELKKFPDVSDESLKSKVCELFSLTGTKSLPGDIDKCHRMQNKSNVIVEFKEREKRDLILRTRKNLKLKANELQSLECSDTMILESLNPVYAMLDYLCRRLKKDRHLFQSWFFNGKLWFIENEGGMKVQVTHINDLYNSFDVVLVDAYLSPRSI